MAKIEDAAIAGYAKAVGLKDDALVTAIAISIAESGGDTNAHNKVPPDDSYGLWQINMLGSMGPARRQQFGLTSNDQLFDPTINAKAMYAISSGGTNWKPWTTYTRGTWLLFKSRAIDAAARSGGVTPGPISGAIDSFQGITALFDQLGKRETWLRIGMLIMGIALVWIAVLSMSGARELANNVGKQAVGFFVGKAKAAKAAKAGV